MAWLRGWERIGQLRDERLLSTWINTIALNCYRRAVYRDRLFQNLSDIHPAEGCMNDASIELSRIMQYCRPEDRHMLEAQLAGMTAEELAAAQGVSQVTIRVRFLRARRAARIGLEKYARPPVPRLAGEKAA
jgi:DNA-directed RNA polymerase specialized sigma24 family protein